MKRVCAGLLDEQEFDVSLYASSCDYWWLEEVLQWRICTFIVAYRIQERCKWENVRVWLLCTWNSFFHFYFQWSLINKNLSFRTRQPWIGVQTLLLIATWLWAISKSLSASGSLICKIRVMILTAEGYVRIKWDTICRMFSRVWCVSIKGRTARMNASRIQSWEKDTNRALWWQHLWYEIRRLTTPV